jgi:hypothetical protein
MHSLPHEQAWRAALAALYNDSEAERLIARIHARHRRLHAERPQDLRRAEARRLDERILPPLALYQTLRETGIDQARALSVTADLLWLTFALLRQLLRVQTRLFYADAGTTFDRTKRHVVLQVRYCFILDILRVYETPELTRVFCEIDDRLGELLPDGVQWQRTDTLAAGAETCHFRYLRRR